MNIELKPTRFVIELNSPVVLSAFAPHFDAIVYEALIQATLLPHDDIIEKMKELILWNDEMKIFHASAMRFGITSEKGVSCKSYVRIDSHRGKLSSDNFMPNGNKDKYVSVMTAGGPYKQRLTERLAYQSPFVCFEAVCNASLIKRLLTNMFIGIGYDAFRAGMGEIYSITTIELPDDTSIFCNGEVRRNVPVQYCADHKGTPSFSPLHPPYFSDLKSDCMSTPRVAVISQDNIDLPI